MIIPFYHESLARGTIDSPEITELQKTVDFLRTNEVNKLAADGSLTVAMIRPNLDSSVLMNNASDQDAAEEIEARIANLGMVTKFSVVFDEQAVEEFYAGNPKEVQLGLPPERIATYDNRWEEFSDLMQSGRTTVLLLHDPLSDAVSLWRRQVGHYDVVNRRDDSTIRGQLALDNYNNLIHGSDAAASVLRELGLLASLLSRRSKV